MANPNCGPKLAAAAGSLLGVPMTNRNGRTVQAIADMLDESDSGV